MSRVERVLNSDLCLLLDRVAATVPPGCLEAIAAERPALRSRLDEVETQLAALRARMTEDYGRWCRTLEDLENLWAVAAWRTTAEEPAEQPASLAA